MSIPILAIIGRPNVGKSTLFNVLTHSRQALVSDCPGLTRDRQYGRGMLGERPYWVIDTGGLAGKKHPIQDLMDKQVHQAIEEADGILFVVDIKEGLMPQDFDIAKMLRTLHKPTWILANKVEHSNHAWAIPDFFKLGLGEPLGIAARQNKGIAESMQMILNAFPVIPEQSPPHSKISGEIQIALVGRPNVGKSTLVNTLLGETRMLVSEIPGTTRDSIHVPFSYQGTPYTLVDTAGVRRRAKVVEKIEKFSVVKTLQTIETAHVVVILLDATEGVVEQDLNLLSYVIQAGKSFVLAINKWDGLVQEAQDHLQRALDRKLRFATYAEHVCISAKTGLHLKRLLTAIQKTYRAAHKTIPTPLLNRLLTLAVAGHPPPLSKGRRIKLRYVHLGGHAPPVLVIHGNQVHMLPESYKQYLRNFYREKLALVGTPIVLEFCESKNPYAEFSNSETRLKRTRF